MQSQNEQENKRNRGLRKENKTVCYCCKSVTIFFLFQEWYSKVSPSTNIYWTYPTYIMHFFWGEESVKDGKTCLTEIEVMYKVETLDHQGLTASYLPEQSLQGWGGGGWARGERKEIIRNKMRGGCKGRSRNVKKFGYYSGNTGGPGEL